MGMLWEFKPHHFFFVLVLIVAAVSGVRPFSDDNVCYRVENYTLTMRKSYMEPVIVRTYEWCLSSLLRCEKIHTEMRRRYEIQSEVRQRNVSECCEGYIKQELLVGGKFIDQCIPISNCISGYIGKDCNIECPQGTWGVKCMQMCDCGAHATCNPINGSCNCPLGWQGSHCENKCEPGKWGLNCTMSCSCIDIFVHCDHVSGDCMVDNNGTIDKPPSSVMSNLSNDETLEKLWSSHPSFYTTDITSVNSIQSTTNESTTSSSDNKINENSNFKQTVTEEIFYSNEATVGDEISSDTTLKTALIDGPIKKYEYANSGKLLIEKGMKSTSVRPLVAVVHVSGKSISGHENMIVTPIGNADPLGTGIDRDIEHPPLPLDVIAIIITGSIIFLGITTLAVLTIFHVRSKLYETIRLAIYDAEKPDTRQNLTLTCEKKNERRFSSLNRSSELLSLSCGYETPRCVAPDRRDATLLRPQSSITRESTYSNQYPNIQLFSNLRELLEAHYDRPPTAIATAFRHPAIDPDGEHLYDEIQLQSTTFATKNQQEILQ